jgi:N-acetylglucosaminyl-diphospho-decaprenol L-rhamnosyltransferase
VILNGDFLVLTVIIVNYRVKYFLEQCLFSVRNAMESVAGKAVEVIVIDNHSGDGSMEYLKPRFPWVQFINNTENAGFGAANNQGLELATGKNILFLNPDTIVSEDSFEKCIALLESEAGAGACGVRMIDGCGRYLKESKRGFPSPWVSFCKFSGLTAIFPHSKIFAQYYLGHLNENENSEVAILSGAFMMAKKEALDKTGGFDERFYMYAEDIDLSQRIRQKGFKNYYLASTSIIHFKGESSPRDLRRLKLFYKAMSQFTGKYFRSYAGGLNLFLMKAAIWAGAGMAALSHLLKRKPALRDSTKTRIYVTGDPSSSSRVSTILLSIKKLIVNNLQEAQEIIFCEGPAFPFKRIIDNLPQNNRRAGYKFHANNSNSIIGSGSGNKMGEVFILHS